MPAQWVDEKHGPAGTSIEHIEVSEEAIASRNQLSEEVIQGPIQFVVGNNNGAQVLEDEMLKFESCRLMSLDADKWGALACYDDMTGDSLDLALVQAAHALEFEYSKKMKVYDAVSRRESKKANRGKLIKTRWLDISKGDSVSPACSCSGNMPPRDHHLPTGVLDHLRGASWAQFGSSWVVLGATRVPSWSYLSFIWLHIADMTSIRRGDCP